MANTNQQRLKLRIKKIDLIAIGDNVNPNRQEMSIQCLNTINRNFYTINKSTANIIIKGVICGSE